MEFKELVEQFWITGKWPLKEYDNTGAFLEFLDSFKTDTLTITKIDNEGYIVETDLNIPEKSNYEKNL